MPNGPDSDDSGGLPPRLSLWQRFLTSLPRLRREGPKAPLVERFKDAVVKPVEPSAASKAKAAGVEMSIEELQYTVTHADDKERLTGLLLAPVAAAISIFISNLLIDSDPAVRLKDGALNPRHVAPATYHELSLVLLVLSVVMLGSAFYRKRLALGIVMALYGLAIFNLHYWGFGIPFILVGSWLLVRAYRLQRDLKEATGGGSARTGSRGRQGRGAPTPERPRPNKRYTPPTSPPKKSPPKPENEKRAG